MTPNVPSAQQSLNRFEDFPVITSAVAGPSDTVITGSVQGPMNSPILIEAFDNDHADPSGYGQGQRFIGLATVTTDAIGNAQFQLNGSAVAVGTFVTATATALNNTSEFSAAVQVQAPGGAAVLQQALPSKPPVPTARRSSVATANSYVVTTTADSGDGSLRAAIMAADAAGTAATISFDIPGSGVQTILPLSTLPRLTGPVTIDGTTQPGYSGTPLIVLDGSAAGPGADGLTIRTFGGGVRGLNVESFSGNGVVLQGGFVRDCFIGTDPTGTLPRGNGLNGIVDERRNGAIGGAGGAGNVISANGQSGIVEAGQSASILGNRIGTNAAGTMALGNGAEGIDVTGGSCTIGGSTLDSGNVISGNASSGVLLEPQAQATIVGGNRIGTNLAGTAAIGNGFSPAARFHDGVTAFNSQSLLVGYATSPSGTLLIVPPNVISGNKAAGISLSGHGQILGSFIGTDTTGSYAIPNGTNGLELTGDGQLGTVADGNVISGNRADGAPITSGWTVSGNRIGTNVAGNAAVPNGGNGIDGSTTTIGPANIVSGNGADGILLRGPATIVDNLIGTDASGNAPLGNAGNGIELRSGNVGIGNAYNPPSQRSPAGNVISANGGSGILVNGYYYLSAYSTSATGSQITANLMGTNAAGIVIPPLGNAGDGVTILRSSGNTIGAIGQGNTIAGNGHNGVSVIELPGDTTPMNQISGNSIFANAALGIDLGDDGVTANVPPPSPARDFPGQWQDFPVITLATVTPNGTVIAGTVQGIPRNPLRIELFDNAAPNPSGYGDGRWFLGQVTVTTDASGNASFELNTLPLMTGSWVTATATDTGFYRQFLANNTSEFSQAVQVSAPPMVLHASFSGQRASPTVSFQFDQNVSPLLSANSLVVSSGTTIVPVTGYKYDSTTNTATFTLSTPPAAGSYQAVLAAGTILGSMLNPSQPGSGCVFSFSYPGPGPADGGVVDFNDLVLVARHFGMSGATRTEGDFTGDGNVDFADLLYVARNYGRSPAP